MDLQTNLFPLTPFSQSADKLPVYNGELILMENTFYLLAISSIQWIEHISSLYRVYIE